MTLRLEPLLVGFIALAFFIGLVAMGQEKTKCEREKVQVEKALEECRDGQNKKN